MFKNLAALLCLLLVQTEATNPKLGFAYALTNGGMNLTEKAEMVNEINAFRLQNGKKPVRVSPKLMIAALEHTVEMARLCKLSYIGEDKSDASERAKRRGFLGGEVTESIAAGHENAKSVVQSWINHPEHRLNLLSDNEVIGFAKAPVSVQDSCKYKMWWSLGLAHKDKVETSNKLLALSEEKLLALSEVFKVQSGLASTTIPSTTAPVAATPAVTVSEVSEVSETEAPVATVSAPAVSTSNSAMSSSEQQGMINAINQFRKENGKTPLQLNSQLMDTAKDHTVEMASRCDLEHAGADGSTPTERALRHGFNGGVAENIAAGQVSVEEVMNSWINSDGHRENLLGDYQYVGFAKIPGPDCSYKMWWTQNFS